MNRCKYTDAALLTAPTLAEWMQPELVLWRYAGLSCVRARIESGTLSEVEGIAAEACFSAHRVPTIGEVRRWFPDACHAVEETYGSFTTEHLLTYFRHDHQLIEPTPTWAGVTSLEVYETKKWTINRRIMTRPGASTSEVRRAFNIWNLSLARGMPVMVHATHIVEVLPRECR